MRTLTLCVSFLFLGVGAVSADQTVFEGSFYDVLITDAVSVGTVEGLKAFTIKIVNTTGDAAYDAGSFGGSFFGYTGITGKLHQHYSALLQPQTATTDSAAYASAIDTHFLFSTTDLSLTVVAPSEDASLASAEPSDAPPPLDAYANTDYGTFLTGTFAVVAAPVLELAYVVVPESHALITLDFFISGAAGGEHIEAVNVPEPATLGLLGLGALALLRRRK